MRLEHDGECVERTRHRDVQPALSESTGVERARGDNVGAATFEIAELRRGRASHLDANRVDERPSIPVGVVGSQRHAPRLARLDSKRPRAGKRTARTTNDNGVTDIGQQPGEVGEWFAGLITTAPDSTAIIQAGSLTRSADATCHASSVDPSWSWTPDRRRICQRAPWGSLSHAVANIGRSPCSSIVTSGSKTSPIARARAAASAVSLAAAAGSSDLIVASTSTRRVPP
jgi:hypothetical protein